ncbi:MAG: REP-associated tyrosine transposase [Terriglobales bacterium]
MRPTREPATNNQQTYMVTSETWGRRDLFKRDPWARLLIDTLYHYRGSAYLLHEFVLMPDHFHILITPVGALERAVQYIKGGFSYRAKKELGSNMEVWQKGFSDHRIRDAEDYERHVEYIHSNPVRKHLCEKPEEYPYSSAHAGFELDPVPQGLKPGSPCDPGGTPEGVPFQGNPQGLKPGPIAPSDSAAEAAPLQSNSQGLKPDSIKPSSGAAKAAPFQSTGTDN